MPAKRNLPTISKETTISSVPLSVPDGLKRLALTSFILAFAIFLIPWLVRGGDIRIETGVAACEIGSLFWAAIVVFAFIRLRKRAFWLLLGIPLTFFWVFLLIVMAYHCGHNPKSCTL